MGREQLGNIRILGELLQHQVHGNTRPLDHGLSRQNPWVRNNAFVVKSLIFFHIQAIIAYRGKGTSRLSVSRSSVQVSIRTCESTTVPQSQAARPGGTGPASALRFLILSCGRFSFGRRFALPLRLCGCCCMWLFSLFMYSFCFRLRRCVTIGACPLRYRGAFSQGRVFWTTCRRRSVVARAVSGWVRGIPCFSGMNGIKPCLPR